jgi:hypothetical protein
MSDGKSQAVDGFEPGSDLIFELGVRLYKAWRPLSRPYCKPGLRAHMWVPLPAFKDWTFKSIQRLDPCESFV